MPRNAFEDGSRKVIPAVLVYVKSADGRILMIHRVDDEGKERPGDFHSGRWNGLGGKLEPGESPLEAAHRELTEEAGLVFAASALRPLGVLQFPNFKPYRAEDWIVFPFVARSDTRARDIKLESSPEGQLHWIEPDKILSLRLWPGDRHFIGWILEERPIMGTLWYENSEVVRHQIVELCTENRYVPDQA